MLLNPAPKVIGRRAAPWAMLFAAALVLGQLLLAVHVVGHLGEPGDAACDICLIGGGSGHSLTASVFSHPPVPGLPPLNGLTLISVSLAQPFHPQSARAPPTPVRF